MQCGPEGFVLVTQLIGKLVLGPLWVSAGFCLFFALGFIVVVCLFALVGGAGWY